MINKHLLLKTSKYEKKKLSDSSGIQNKFITWSALCKTQEKKSMK